MSLYVVTLPTLSNGDRALVETARARFDSQHDAVSPHATLVFAIERLDVDALASHVVSLTRGVARFSCMFRRTLVAPDIATAGSCVLLVPDEGREELTRLPDALYTGVLAADLRSDLAFVPHITVARTRSTEDARSIAESLDPRLLTMKAQIDTSDVVVAIKGQSIRAARKIVLT